MHRDTVTDAIARLYHDALAAKPAGSRGIGIEVERAATLPDGRPLPYSDTNWQGQTVPGMGSLLQSLYTTSGSDPYKSPNGKLLGFSIPDGKVSIEPGSQLEFSSVPFADLGQAAKAIQDFESLVRRQTEPNQIRWLTLAVHPEVAWNEVELIPSPRYQIMTDYLNRQGTLGTSMMRLTTSVQINLDYASEAEGIAMLRTALLTVPLSYALFANSPMHLGKKTGHLSFRSHIWRNTDPSRTGLLPHVFADDFGFSSHAQFLATRPLMFATNDAGEFVAAEGASFADLALGKIPGASASTANAWNAVRENFPEVRFKPGYIEVRAVDGLPPAMRYAAAAFWMSVLYSPRLRELAAETFGEMSAAAREALWIQASQKGLSTLQGVQDLHAIAEEWLPECRQFLKSRALGEEKFLEPLEELVASGTNLAQKNLGVFEKEGLPGLWQATLET